MSKELRRFGIDLLSLSQSDWSNPQTLESIVKLVKSLRHSDSTCEVFLVGPKAIGDRIEKDVAGPGVSCLFVPLPALLMARIYIQQTFLPLYLRVRGVNHVISFGRGVPVLYPAPRVLTLLPGQSKEWWNLIPALFTADAVTVDTDAQRDALRDRVPAIRSKIERLPPAVGEEYHPYPKEAGRELFESRGVKGRYFLHLGRIDSSSPSMITLDAFGKIAHRPRVKSMDLVFLGPRGVSSGLLRKRIDELGLVHRTKLIDDADPRDWPLWLSNAQFAVLSRAASECPSLLLRALASGCPLIVPDSELIETRFKAAVLPCLVSDPKVLAESMTKLLADVALRDQLVRTGLQLTESLSWDKRVDALVRVLEGNSLQEAIAEPVSA